MATESTSISVREAARRLGVHENTVRRYADRGLIRAERLPSGVRRIRRDDIEALEMSVHREATAEPDRQPRRTLAQPTIDQGVEPIHSLDDLIAPELWRSDEELRDFLALTYRERDRDR